MLPGDAKLFGARDNKHVDFDLLFLINTRIKNIIGILGPSLVAEQLSVKWTTIAGTTSQNVIIVLYPAAAISSTH